MSAKKKNAGKRKKEQDSHESWTPAGARLHCRIGWWSLLFFLTLGSALEALHWLKIDWYLDASHETRRLMWRLAHAHGTLLGLIHLGFGITLNILRPPHAALCKLASRCLIGAGILLPGGFFLGGLVVYGGDPGLGILLVPVGALLLFVAVLVSALLSSAPSSAKPSDQSSVEK